MTELRIEYPSAGATYSHPEFGVYEYGIYERGSVLEGMERRSFLDSFPTLAEAKSAYPEASSAGCGYREVSLPHSAPRDFDPLDAGESWDEDDY